MIFTSVEFERICPYCSEAFDFFAPSSQLYCSYACKKKVMDARWREKSPGYMRQYLYGITPDEYDAMFESQGRCCAICQSETHNSKGWHMDHDHVTGANRGILCGNCNNGLGNFRDNPLFLQSAIEYLGR